MVYPEAPRYLVKTGRLEEAVESFKRIAHINGIVNTAEEAQIQAELQVDHENDDSEDEELLSDSQKSAAEVPGVMYFLRQRVILNNQIVLTIVWSVTVFTFYLNNTFLKYMPGNFEDNFLAVVTSDIFVTLAC